MSDDVMIKGGTDTANCLCVCVAIPTYYAGKAARDRVDHTTSSTRGVIASTIRHVLAPDPSRRATVVRTAAQVFSFRARPAHARAAFARRGMLPPLKQNGLTRRTIRRRPCRRLSEARR